MKNRITSGALVAGLLAWLLAGPVQAAGHKTYYIAPQGSDRNSGLAQGKPMRSFYRVFRKMQGGDELVLLDGEYSDKNGNGFISFRGRHSEQIPSGSKKRRTVVRALNRGKAYVHGQLFIGRSTRKDHDIVVDGITFKGGVHLYNTERIYIKNSGFEGPFALGTNDHDFGNTYNVIEDSWIWASGERIIATNYRSDYNVWRRVVIRGDGCALPACLGSGNPNVGITVYESNHVSVQNVIVVDRILGLGSPYGDFAAAQHTPGNYLFGKNEWLGTISVNAPDTGYYLEPDQGGTTDETIHFSNVVAWRSHEAGINITRSGTNNILENLTVAHSGFDGIRIGRRLTSGILRNAISYQAGRYAINSAYPFVDTVVYRPRVKSYYVDHCVRNCRVSNVMDDARVPSLKYPVRIEEGSPLKGAGKNGQDIGANVVYRYGRDGAAWGEPGFNELTRVPLWPWKNEDLIKQQMCRKTERGFCAKGTSRDRKSPLTLTRYIWELAGHTIPASVYRANNSR